MDQDKIIGIGKAAALLGVHPDTLRQWEKNGQIKSIRTKGNHRRYRVSDLKKAEDENFKWDKFAELVKKYEWHEIVSNEKAINEWLYFHEDYDPMIASNREFAKEKGMDEASSINYALIMLLCQQRVKEYNLMIECNDIAGEQIDK